MSSYEIAKYKWENTDPIRGRAVECRPIGARNKSYKEVKKGDGYYSYALHQRELVKFYDDGTVGIKCDGWLTNSPVEFLNAYVQGCTARIYDNRLWVNGYPVPIHGELRMACTASFTMLRPVEPIKMWRTVSDNTKRKAIREELKDFLGYAKVMLTLTGGKVTHTMQASVAVERRVNEYSWRSPIASYMHRHQFYDVYKALKAMTDPTPEDWLGIMCGHVSQWHQGMEYDTIDGISEPTILVAPEAFVKKFLNHAYLYAGATKRVLVECDGKLMKDLSDIT